VWFNFSEKNSMRNKSMVFRSLLAILTLALTQTSFAQNTTTQQQADANAMARQKALNGPPDATADFEQTQFRLIVGGASGKGVLHFNGKDYPFTMSGVSVGGVGYTDEKGTMHVYFLKNIADFPGTFNAAGAGIAVGDSIGKSTYSNMKEVVLVTKSKGTGLALNLGLSSISIKLDK
jgi:hypothetical protein